MDVTKFMDALLARAKESRFEAAECYLCEDDSFQVGIHEGEIKSYDVSSSLGLGFRALIGGKMGYAATQALDEAAIGQLIDGVKTNARLIDSPDIQFIHPGDAQYPELRALDPALESVTAAEKIERALLLEKTARSLDPRVTQIDDCALFTSRSQVRIVNTRGQNLCFTQGGAGMYVSAVAREGDEVNTGFKFRFARGFDELDVMALSREAVDEACSGLGGAPVASGSYRVALGNEAAANMLTTFASSFSADAAQKGLSLLGGREGERVASGCVTLIDDPLYPYAFAGAPFDGEGVAARAKKVIDGGVLTTLLHNLKTAHKQGVPTTGNAARTSYASQVSVAPTNFFIKPGARDRDALLKTLGDGLLITELQGLHAGANAVSGAFSLSAKGFLIEGGRIARPVSGITAAGNFFELLGQVEEVGGDLWFSVPGTSCVGSPTLLVGALTIAGR